MATRGQRWAYWLEAALEERGWSRAEIAKRSGTKSNGRPIIDASRVSEWLNKNESPRDPEILHEIARVLGVRVGTVLNAAGWLPDEEIEEVSTDAAVVSSVAEAIKRDTDLLDEAREHLLNQYELLRRLAPAPSKKAPAGRPKNKESIEERRERLRAEQSARHRATKGSDAQRATRGDVAT